MRNTYWSCTKFADWLRGTEKIKVGTSEECEDWEKQAKARYPLRLWLAEEGLDRLQRFLMWPMDRLYAIKYYINNRFITRTHALIADPRDIPPGQWCDVGNRFLPCLFNELVNFVEIELAWWHLAWASPEDRKKYRAPWWRFGWWNVRLWRCAQAGVDNLKWQSQLRWTENEVGKGSLSLGQPTPQAEQAQEILALYKWWTEVYRTRPDPYEVSGWNDYCNARQQETDGGLRWLGGNSKNKKIKKQGERAHKLLRKIEEQYEKENEEMMIRLIKIRNSLWT